MFVGGSWRSVSRHIVLKVRFCIYISGWVSLEICLFAMCVHSVVFCLFLMPGIGFCSGVFFWIRSGGGLFWNIVWKVLFKGVCKEVSLEY